MTIAKKLPKSVLDAIAGAEGELRQFLENQDDARSSRSEKWLESDAGEAHQAWLDELGQLLEALENPSYEWEA